MSWGRLLRLPQADSIICAAAGKQPISRIPLDLLNLSCVSSGPHLDRALWLLNIPQEDANTVACDRDGLTVLPINFDPDKIRVQLRMHQLGNILSNQI